MGQLGDLLRQTRESQGLSLEQVEATTRIRRALLEALEREAFHELPAPVFAKGLLRNYALFLGLDAAQVLNMYKEAAGRDALEYKPRALSEPLVSEERRAPWGLLALLPILLLGLAVWWGYREGWLTFSNMRGFWTRDTSSVSPSASREETLPVALAATHTLTPSRMPTSTFVPTGTPTPMPPTETPTAELTATATETLVASPTPLPAITVELEMVQHVWLRVYADGRKLFEGLAEKGSRQVWVADKQLYVHAGDGKAVVATVNGRLYGPLSQEAETVRVEWTLAPGTPSVSSPISPTQVVLPSLAAETPQAMPTRSP